MQHVVITGASQGIGYETARLFAERGDKVIAIARNSYKLKQLASTHENITALPHDITQTNSVSICELVSAIFPQIDILINNAGCLLAKEFEEYEYAEVLKMFEINVIGAGWMLKDLMPLLKKSERAHVVNISSMGGFQGSSKFASLSWYSASKAALASLTEVLAAEYKDSSMRFNCLALGAVQTEMLDSAFPGYQAPVNASEMAEYIVDFALNGHRFFNGKVLPVSVTTP